VTGEPEAATEHWEKGSRRGHEAAVRVCRNWCAGTTIGEVA
jgi:hypothetical protein